MAAQTGVPSLAMHVLSPLLSPTISYSTGREAHESDGSELGAHDSFGSGDGQGDRLERADVIDFDGVERRGAQTDETAEFGENAESSRRTPPRSGALLQKAGRTTKSTKSTK